MSNLKYSDLPAEKQAPAAPKIGQVIPLHPVKKDETGRVIADDIAESFRNTVTAPEGAEDAVTLWCMFTHAFDHAKVSPRLLFWSPTPECGKTEALKFVTSLSRGAIPSSNVSPALLPRLFESRKACPPTLIIDEYDSMSKEKQSALTNIYNSGHDKAMAYSLILVRDGDDWTEKRLSTWGPIALASKEKELTPASMSRSIVIRLEHDPDMRGDVYEVDSPSAKALHGALKKWAKDNSKALAAAFQTAPDYPDGLGPRERQNWKHLLQIAEVLGGDWPERTRWAALALSRSESATDINVRLLAAIKAYFDETGDDAVWSAKLCRYLNDQEGAPWFNWNYGEGIKANDLAKRLRNFNQRDGQPIKSLQMKRKSARGKSINQRGYRRQMFDRVFEQYGAKMAR